MIADRQCARLAHGQYQVPTVPILVDTGIGVFPRISRGLRLVDYRHGLLFNTEVMLIDLSDL